MTVEPLPGVPAAVADLPDGRALVVADYHAGLEVGLRSDGVELRSHAAERRQTVLELLDRSDATRLVLLGDLGHAIGEPGAEERAELEALLSALHGEVSVTLVTGNHDGELESVFDEHEVTSTVTPGHGVRIGPVGFAHGHTWPSPDVLSADLLCIGHEHPVVRLEDEVGGARAERAWLRGDLDPEPFVEQYDDSTLELAPDPELIVCPAFNDLTGGTWSNVQGQDFLAPFLPDGLRDGQAYLLDGTRLGAYQDI